MRDAIQQMQVWAKAKAFTCVGRSLNVTMVQLGSRALQVTGQPSGLPCHSLTPETRLHEHPHFSRFLTVGSQGFLPTHDKSAYPAKKALLAFGLLQVAPEACQLLCRYCTCRQSVLQNAIKDHLKKGKI